MRALAIRLGAQPWLPRLAPVVLGLDKALFAATRGRAGVLSMSGLPWITLTVVGRRTGLVRRVPLLAVPHDDGWLIAGSNWGGPATPAWVANLTAAGRAVATRSGRDTPMSARRVTGSERAQLWGVMLATWPNFERYAQRTTREIPVFVLTPVGPTVAHVPARARHTGGRYLFARGGRHTAGLTQPDSTRTEGNPPP
jgi:deazaflavin-dependent oxidoreductase (nitroreductase family)